MEQANSILTKFLIIIGGNLNQTPTPSGEVDYQTWRLSAKQLLATSTNDREVRRSILESLQRPAPELVSHLENDAAKTIFDELELIYGKVMDKHAVLAKLHSRTYFNVC